MSGLGERRQAPRFFAVRRKRRPFGLDAPRPRDPRRVAADIRGWIDRHLPAALVLRLEVPDLEPGPTLIVLLPGCRAVVFSVETAVTGRAGLAEVCRSRGIPLARVSTVDEARAALRRFGIEPEED